MLGVNCPATAEQCGYVQGIQQLLHGVQQQRQWPAEEQQRPVHRQGHHQYRYVAKLTVCSICYESASIQVIMKYIQYY